MEFYLLKHNYYWHKIRTHYEKNALNIQITTCFDTITQQNVSFRRCNHPCFFCVCLHDFCVLVFMHDDDGIRRSIEHHHFEIALKMNNMAFCVNSLFVYIHNFTSVEYSQTPATMLCKFITFRGIQKVLIFNVYKATVFTCTSPLHLIDSTLWALLVTINCCSTNRHTVIANEAETLTFVRGVIQLGYFTNEVTRALQPHWNAMISLERLRY